MVEKIEKEPQSSRSRFDEDNIDAYLHDYLELSHDNRNNFDAYVNQNTEPTEDILACSRNRDKGFRKLQPMARDILAMQASSVASEGVFSATRHSLAADSLEISVLFRDWINAERRNLDREPLPPNFKMTLMK
uniref:HAT C-terminal dimerisation domain-containing protein n=1 Tax=Solanum lycopersicum TaxID=4081 RepID=A0A3Q7FM66_SOLLC